MPTHGTIDEMDVVWHDAARTEYLWRHLGDWWKSNCLGRPDPLGDTCPLGKLIEKRPTRSVSLAVGGDTDPFVRKALPPTDSRGRQYRFVVEQIATADAAA